MRKRTRSKYGEDPMRSVGCCISVFASDLGGQWAAAKSSASCRSLSIAICNLYVGSWVLHEHPAGEGDSERARWFGRFYLQDKE
jgi:hypothetical protein